MAATTGYLAGTDSNDLEMSYVIESAWGTTPSANFQKFRVNSESFRERKTRIRSPEIRSDAQAAAQTTTEVQASGGHTSGISYGNLDDQWACLVLGEWTADLNISGTGIAVDGTNEQFEGAAGDFDDVTVGQWIKVAGFATAANNGYHRVTDKAVDGSTITVASNLTTEASGASVTITGSMLRNGTTFRSLTYQKKFSSTLWFNYPGSFPTGGQINAQRGQYFSATLDVLCKHQAKATAALGTGFVAAPTKKVMDTVGHFKSLNVSDLPSASKINALNTTLTREGAGMAFGLGSKSSIGLTSKGLLTASGTIDIYFDSFEFYDEYDAETPLVVSYRVSDGPGNTYIVTTPELVLNDPEIVAGGQNQAVMARYQWGADPSETYGNTWQMDRFAA